MIPLGPVVARNKARVARAAVWQYLVDSERRKVWWPELRLDARVGGAVSERWAETSGDSEVSRDASGEVDVLVEGHAIGFRWSEAGDEHSTAVLVTLRSSGPDTGITVTETGFDALPTPAESAAASQEGWQVLLSDLVAAVESAVAAGAFSDDPEATEQIDVDDSTVAVAEGDVEETLEDSGAEPEEPVLEPADALELEAEGEAAIKESVADLEPAAADSSDEATDDPEEPNFDDLIRGPRSN